MHETVPEHIERPPPMSLAGMLLKTAVDIVPVRLFEQRRNHVSLVAEVSKAVPGVSKRYVSHAVKLAAGLAGYSYCVLFESYRGNKGRVVPTQRQLQRYIRQGYLPRSSEELLGRSFNFGY